MKNRVVVTKGNDKLDFYLHNEKGRFYLFTQDYTKGVYKHFENGRSEAEIREFNKWRKNPRLNKTIQKLPVYIRYVTKYEMA